MATYVYKITCTIDGEPRWQTSENYREYHDGAYRVIRYGQLYLTEAAAEQAANALRWSIDEHGEFYESPANYRVEPITRADLQKPQELVLRCPQCGSECSSDSRLPFRLYHDLVRLTWRWCIDPDDFRHDPGCDFRSRNLIRNLRILDDEGPSNAGGGEETPPQD